MGSIQSRNKNPNFVNSDVRIIVTDADQYDNSDNEEEFFECLSDMIDNNGLVTTVSHDETSRDNHVNGDENDQDDLQNNSNKESDTDSDDSCAENKKRLQKELEEFREEISRKRALRQQCIKKMRDEMKDLNDKLSYQLMINEQLRETIESKSNEKCTNEMNAENKNLKMELAECQMYLQKLNGENLNTMLENQALRDHIRSLKEVNKAMKEMLAIRECQVDQLKSKLEEIECSFSEKETKILSTDLKQEYQRQLENIKKMRTLYEERSNLLLQENNVLKQQLGDKEHDLQTETEKSKNLEEYITTLESNLNVKNTDITTLENEISQLRSDKSQIDEEMNAVNQLISQILFDFNSSGSGVNFDMLHNMLEENRDFLKEMAMKENYGGVDTGSFLPKILYDIFLQVNQNSSENSYEENNNQKHVNTPEEIALKLPKVWRILIELLSHQNKLKEEDDEVDKAEKAVLDDCYKSIQTTAGPQAVLSVSKTFIKLRDLIFEKRSLQKDTTRLKTLYSHLEQRLDKQEKKLSSVSLELTKTWHLVGKIKRQHRQLHTHEQILCYQLQQKRRVLNELKAELEYCRKKWALARAINKESEKQCQEMRNEFLLRKIQDQNSGESGYSDEHPSDGDECEKENTICDNDKKKRFERNLSEFYRTPLYLIDSDRRRSLELPILYKIISEDNIPSRAQSEPPVKTDNTEIENRVYYLPEQDFEEKSQASYVAVEIDPLENISSNSVMVTLPPDVHEFRKTDSKIKHKLQKQKRHKKKRNQKKGTETAEEMFNRLVASINGEASLTSTSEGIDEELEHIEEIPLDIEQKSFLPEQKDENFTENSPTPELISIVQDRIEIEEPTPSISPSNEEDYLKNREARLARLEAETKEFYEKMTRDRQKRKELDNRLTTVHKNFLERQKDKCENTNNEPSTSSESQNTENDQEENEQKTDENDELEK